MDRCSLYRGGCYRGFFCNLRCMCLVIANIAKNKIEQEIKRNIQRDIFNEWTALDIMAK